MGFQDDWMMRQIEMMAKFVANVVFNDYESKNVDLIRKVQEQKGYF